MKIILNKDEVMEILCKHFGCHKDALHWEGNPEEEMIGREAAKESKKKKER